MTENNNSNTSMSKRNHWHGMCAGGSCRTFCGIFLLVAGLFLLGQRTNFLPAEFTNMFWPFIMVLMGIWFIAASLTGKRARN